MLLSATINAKSACFVQFVATPLAERARTCLQVAPVLVIQELAILPKDHTRYTCRPISTFDGGAVIAIALSVNNIQHEELGQNKNPRKKSTEPATGNAIHHDS